VYGAYGFMLVLGIIMLFTGKNAYSRERAYEDTLDAILLACPDCENVFEFKERNLEGARKIAFSCPVCGAYGALPGLDAVPVKKRLPDGDVRENRYACDNCKEDIRVGVFGDETLHESNFRACPHCGERNKVRRVAEAA